MNGQNEVRVQHYERSTSFDEVILPTNNYTAQSFQIFVPDSIYTGGDLRVKKLKWNGIKVRFSASFSENTYQYVTYRIKKKDQQQFEAIILKHLNRESLIDSIEYNGQIVLIKKTILGSKIMYELSLKKG